MRHLHFLIIAVAVATWSCGEPIAPPQKTIDDETEEPTEPDEEEPGTDEPDDEEPGTDEPDDEEPEIEEPTEPTTRPLRFIAIGDQGTGSTGQYKVAEQMKKKCDADGCDFVILLGDNIYDAGVSSVNDEQWQEKFEKPYAAIDLPFYAVLGNHDYGGSGVPLLPSKYDKGGMGGEWAKGPYEVQYTQHSTKWKMPDTFYTMKHGDVCFMMLDTNSIFWNDWRYGDQREWYGPALEALGHCEWVFTAGHHCYTSNGKHGRAGAYEGIELPFDLSDKWAFFDGRHIKSFFDEIVKDSADVILAGHDHNRQWLEPNQTLGAEIIVSGGGAKTTANQNRGFPTFFEEYDKPGFLWIEIDGKTMTGQFYDFDGNFEFERVVTKP